MPCCPCWPELAGLHHAFPRCWLQGAGARPAAWTVVSSRLPLSPYLAQILSQVFGAWNLASHTDVVLKKGRKLLHLADLE